MTVRRAAFMRAHSDENWQLKSAKMSNDQNTPRAGPANRHVDLLSMLYHEIGIPAVAAALEATARKPQKSSQRKDIPAVLRNDEAA